MWQAKWPDRTRNVTYVSLIRAAIWMGLRRRDASAGVDRAERAALRTYLAELDYTYRVVEAACGPFTTADNELFAKLELPRVESV